MSLAWLRRAALGAALAIAALLVEIGLDEVVGTQPWYVVSFMAVLVATVVGGTPGGGTAALAGWFFNALVVPALVPTGPVVPILDAVNHGAAFVLGSTLVPDRRIASSARRRLAPEATAERGGQPPVPDHLVETMVRVIDELAAARSPAQVADAEARGFAELFGAASTRVYVRASADEPLVQRARAGRQTPGGPDRIEAADEGPLGRAARSGRSIALGERLVVPVRRGDEVLALVDLDGVPEPPTVQVQAVAASLARLAAEAVGRQQLLAQRRIAGDEASAASERVAVLGRLAARLAGAATVDAVGAVLVEQSVAALGAEFGLLYERDRRSGVCMLVEAKGYPVGLAEHEAMIAPDADGPVATAVRSGRPVEVGSPDAWRRHFPRSSNTLTMTGTHSIAALPLGEGGVVAGVLVLGWSTAAPADDRRSVLAAIVDQGAQALERARLHAQERDAHRLQEAFVSVISHELRTPITTILAGSRILRRRVESAPLAADLAADIEAEAERLARIVEDLLVLSRLERRNLEIAQEPVHLLHLVERVIASESRRWPNRTFVKPERVDVAVARGEETYVEQVLRNLLSNAAKYSPEGSTVEVAVEADGPRTTVRVLDEGPGIAREEIHKLFTLFYRSPSTAAAAAGAGIGLFVARRLVDEMGGEMWVRPRDRVGSEFGFSLTTFPADEDEDDAPGEPGGDGAAQGGDHPGVPAAPADSGATVG